MPTPWVHVVTVAAALVPTLALLRRRPPAGAWRTNRVASGPTAVTFGPSGMNRWRAGLPAVVALAGFVAWSPWGLAAGVCVVAARRANVARAARLRRESRREELWQFVLLLELALHGGVSLQRAMQDVLPWTAGELAELLSGVLAATERGHGLADVLDECAAGVWPELQGFARLAGATQRFGAPASAALAAMAAQLLLERRLRLEHEGRRLPVRLLLPLIGGVLPAFVLLTVVPMVASALHTVHGFGG